MLYNPTPARIAAILTVLAALIALRFAWRYFTHIQYALTQERRLQAWVSISAISLPLAFLALAVDITGRLRLEPMTIHPIEHIHSIERVALNLFVSGLSLLAAAWIARRPEHLRILPKRVLLVVLPFGLFCASLFVMYPSWINWCCEPVPGIFAGYPFSGFYVITSDALTRHPPVDYAVLIRTFYDAGQLKFLHARFNILFLDGLFWINTVYLWLCLAGWISLKIRRPAVRFSQE
jgi:hypothetical protein